MCFHRVTSARFSPLPNFFHDFAQILPLFDSNRSSAALGQKKIKCYLAPHNFFPHFCPNSYVIWRLQVIRGLTRVVRIASHVVGEDIFLLKSCIFYDFEKKLPPTPTFLRNGNILFIFWPYKEIRCIPYRAVWAPHYTTPLLYAYKNLSPTTFYFFCLVWGNPAFSGCRGKINKISNFFFSFNFYF